MKIPVYPKDFYTFGSHAKICDGEVNKWIAEFIKRLEEKPKTLTSSMASGDTMVKVERNDEDGTYEVYVYKNYSYYQIDRGGQA